MYSTLQLNSRQIFSHILSTHIVGGSKQNVGNYVLLVKFLPRFSEGDLISAFIKMYSDARESATTPLYKFRKLGWFLDLSDTGVRIISGKEDIASCSTCKQPADVQKHEIRFHTAVALHYVLSKPCVNYPLAIDSQGPKWCT